MPASRRGSGLAKRSGPKTYSEQVSMPRPDFGLAYAIFSTKVFGACKVVPSSLDSGRL